MREEPPDRTAPSESLQLNLHSAITSTPHTPSSSANSLTSGLSPRAIRASVRHVCDDLRACPPRGLLENTLVAVVTAVAVGLVSVTMFAPSLALPPNGPLFAIELVLGVCLLGGRVAAVCHLPQLLGMLAAGMLLANITPSTGIDSSDGGNSSSSNSTLSNTTAVNSTSTSLQTVVNVVSGGELSASLRSVALAVILTRAGLGLDTAALRRLSAAVARLAFSPCACETLSVCVAARLILALPWTWAALLGCVLAAVSPAVVVPGMLSLQRRRYGIQSGVPTLVNAAASVDDVLAITGFGVMMGLTFADGSVGMKLAMGALDLVLGAGYGVLTGCLLWFLPGSGNRSVTLLRVTLLSCLALLSVFGSQAAGFAGAGALGCLTLAFVANHGWRKQGWKTDNAATESFAVFWFVFQPLLFGLIGLELKLNQLRTDMVWYGLCVLAIGLAVRVVVTFFVVLGSGLSVRERLFVAIAWLPKATVQAAIGPVALDYARKHAATSENLEYGQQILTLAVLAILITAPIGAAGIAIAGPRLLKKAPAHPSQENTPIDD